MSRDMVNPSSLDKYIYIRKTPTWLVRLLYGIGILSWILVLYGYSSIILIDPVFRWFFAPIVAVLSVYQFSSFGLNLFYRQFDLQKHAARVDRFWTNPKEPSVDIFLPICGESIEILTNTWKHVSRMRYRNVRVYVLDDSTEHCEKHKMLARFYGFTYLERPNKGEMKKAGNMKYAFERTHGDYIVILDGDFAPHSDFLYELIPYMDDQNVGIVQTPQYFETSGDADKSRYSALSYGSARAQEIFYRVVQVARDRLGSAHCCGTSAIYRRAALNSIGGFAQMGHSEDAHTGFQLTSKGWIVRYVPIILSIGLCPDNIYTFFHQQHRWCLGNIVMILNKQFWLARLPRRIKFC